MSRYASKVVIFKPKILRFQINNSKTVGNQKVYHLTLLSLSFVFYCLLALRFIAFKRGFMPIISLRLTSERIPLWPSLHEKQFSCNTSKTENVYLDKNSAAYIQRSLQVILKLLSDKNDYTVSLLVFKRKFLLCVTKTCRGLESIAFE